MGRTTVARHVWLVTLALTPSLAPHNALAQEARGEIVDDTRKPVADVSVALLDGQRRVVANASSDETGAFSVIAPDDGEYFVYLTRIGYRSLFDGPYQLEGGLALELFAVMHALPITLEGVDVSVDAADAKVPRLASVGFYERRAVGFGHFIERAQVVRMSGASITDVLRSVPRVSVKRNTGGTGGASGLLTPEVRMRGGMRGECVPTLFVDGVIAETGGVHSNSALRPDEFLTPDLVEAIEVYTGPAQTPLQYLPRSACGVILVWTRHARRRR